MRRLISLSPLERGRAARPCYSLGLTYSRQHSPLQPAALPCIRQSQRNWRPIDRVTSTQNRIPVTTALTYPGSLATTALDNMETQAAIRMLLSILEAVVTKPAKNLHQSFHW
jgi:hypothetical protein